ncbi:PAS domain-containing protein [Salinirubellus sp. GCM10025818]|uniref:PAS domain-containing protein n=1 Tax=Salinirubellus TaxID=2162630 RepID=UPI0030D62E2C
MVGIHSRAARILLLVTGERDRELLEGWLADEPDYEAVSVDSPTAVDAADYDLCLVDPRWFDRAADRLRDRREAAAPCLLPTLLAVRDDGSGRDRAALESETAREVIDDVVEIPVGKATLGQRIGNLLRGRHSSLELADRREQYRELVRLAPEAILLVRGGRVVYGNDTATELLASGDSPDLSGQAIAELADEEGVARLEGIVDRIERDGGLAGFVSVELVLADGTERIVEVAGVTVTYEGEPTTQLVVRDVTDERRRSERLLLYARTLESASQGVTIADARRDDEPIVYANPAFERITGYDAAEILGRNCRFLQGEGTDPETVDEIRAAIAERRSISTELRNYRKDGTPFWNRLDIVPVRNGDGEVTHFLGLQQDVTRRREREQRVAVLDRVLRHNLRNQLNVVRGEADRILAEEEVDPDEARAAAEGIVRATDELLDIGDQARRFREVVTGEPRQPGVVDLRRTLEEAVAGLGSEYPGVTTDIGLPESVPVYAHEAIGVAFLGVVEMLAETGGGAVDIAVRTVDVSPKTVTVEVIDRAGGLCARDLRVVEGGTETQVIHPQGVELWLLRWSVEHSGGEFDVDTGGTTPRILLRLRRAEGGDERVESLEANADD